MKLHKSFCSKNGGNNFTLDMVQDSVVQDLDKIKPRNSTEHIFCGCKFCSSFAQQRKFK